MSTPRLTPRLSPSPHTSSSHSPYTLGAPALTPVTGLTPQAPAGTPAGDGTPAGAHTPLPGQAQNSLRRFISRHNLGDLHDDLFEALSAGSSEEIAMLRKNATEGGGKTLDLLYGENGDTELNMCKVLNLNELSQKFANIFYGCIVDFDLLTEIGTQGEAAVKGNERLKTLFEMEWLSDTDRQHVRDEAFRKIEVMDGGGIGGDAERVEGSLCCLDPGNRANLTYAAKVVLNMLEHNQWAAELPARDVSTAGPSLVVPETEAGPSTQDESAHDVPTVRFDAPDENEADNAARLSETRKRSASTEPLEEGVSRGAHRPRHSSD